jgi:hypothetical protein
MARKYLDTDPLSGTRHYIDYDENEDRLDYITELNIDAILKHNHFDRTTQPRQTYGRDMVFAARLPINVLQDLQRRGIFQDPKAYLKWLEQHPEWKTWDGALI